MGGIFAKRMMEAFVHCLPSRLLDQPCASYSGFLCHFLCTIWPQSSGRGWDEMKWLINNGGAEVNSLIWKGRTPLHVAASGDDCSIVQWLVETGANVDAPDDDGITPLHEAARSGQLDVLTWLVDRKNVDVNRRYDEGVTLLHYAAYSEEIPLLEWLIEEKGAAAKVTIEETMLLLAARFGHWHVVRFLAELDAVDVGVESLSGRMVLFHAVKQDDIQTIEWLVNEKGIHVSPTYANGNSILHHAIAAGSIILVKWLIRENNADPNEIDNEGCAPLSRALESGKMEIFQWLLGYGEADVNVKDSRGMTSLHVAAKLHSEVIDTLVNDYDADIDALDNDGKRPIDLYGDGPDRESLESGSR